VRRALPILLLCALAAGCGGGGSGGHASPAADSYPQRQTAACAKVQKTLARIPRPKTGAKTRAAKAREGKALERYALAIDRRLIAGLRTLRSVKAPEKLQPVRRKWLAAVRVALRARLRLDTAPAKQLQKASRAELKTRRTANDLAGQLGIASGCTLTY
jgi:hypothetical protein